MTDQHRPVAQSEGSPSASDLSGLPEIISSVVDAMRRGRIERLVVTRGDFHLELESAGSSPATAPQTAQPASAGEPDDPADEDSANTHVITSPMIGTFYVAPAPGEPPFVKVGDTVSQGDTIGIVEAMKIMNEIAADRSGIVAEITATDGETVEYGSPLVLLEVQS